MDILSIFLIAVGLALDAFAVSVASGVIMQRQRVKQGVTFGLLFGGFQMLMPVVGYAAGKTLRPYICAIDHWVAFALLVAIGAKMIYEATRMEEFEQAKPDMTVIVLLGLAVATSIDALAVGISFALLNIPIVIPVIVIGVMTFVLSFAGVFLGNMFGGLLEKKVEILGGLVLIGMGVKILLEHLRG
jgi:putative Mn2+ efflux pump MntP